MRGCVALDGLTDDQGVRLLTEFAVDTHDPMMAMLEQEAVNVWNSNDVPDRFTDLEDFCAWYIADAQAG